MSAPKLFIVIPCYNEQEALPITARRLVAEKYMRVVKMRASIKNVVS